MFLRVDMPAEQWPLLLQAMDEIGKLKNLSIRVWSPDLRAAKPRLAICTTYRPEPALALLRAIRDGLVKAEATLMLGNRPNCRALAEQFEVPWFDVGDAAGNPDEERLVALCDEHEVDYVILARYMRVMPAATCWKYAGGRIINLHHGLLPSFPGLRPYNDAYAARMLTFGRRATTSCRSWTPAGRLFISRRSPCRRG